ncbi:glycine betaine transporter [Desulfocicer vacuolatum DSM 3385]|uniref:Glycine betaine transporter n=1 Tax=Desulfocicer vacuolatum DSM 3385 TaxID=1121400 RepID=A0A1W2EBM4_9BACT|nr:BCCT family transporter [Desulfocicer vacuolatum]SMD07160.1 glycine betaine transporter [Desulfocicer vacuolatum DSM 3385]
MTQSKKGISGLVNKQVFYPPALLLVAVVVFGAILPDQLGVAANGAFSFCIKYFSWFYAMGVGALFVFVLWAGLGRYGDIRLGGADAQPEMSFFSWFAIALTSGIAIGIVFYGVAEPLGNYTNPAGFTGLEPRSAEAAEGALRTVFLHWGLHPYATYTAFGLFIAFLYHNQGKSFKISTGLYPLLGEKVNGLAGNLIDALCIFSIVAGIGTSLGIGAMQLGAGMGYVMGSTMDSVLLLWFAIIASMAVFYTVAACTGLHKGIKIISNLNVYIYFALLLWVFLFGPTLYILNNTSSALGDYLSSLTRQSLYLEPALQTGWVGGWTIFYWSWWLAFAPMVGLFLVKLAKGRTIKEFVMVNFFAPSLFAVVWFGVFGSAGIFMEHFQGIAISEEISKFGTEVALFAFLKNLPLPGILNIMGFLAIVFSFVTLAESMTLTLANMTSSSYESTTDEQDAPNLLKIFWGAMMAGMAFVLLMSGGLKSLQTAVVVCGLPILLLGLVMCVGFVKNMKLATGEIKPAPAANATVSQSFSKQDLQPDH